LGADHAFEGVGKGRTIYQASFASRSRVAAYLKAAESVRKYDRHQAPPEPKHTPLEQPHQEWEVDAQGKTARRWIGGRLDHQRTDVVSHFKIASLPCPQTTHANTLDYQLTLRQAFVQYGYPIKSAWITIPSFMTVVPTLLSPLCCTSG